MTKPKQNPKRLTKATKTAQERVHQFVEEYLVHFNATRAYSVVFDRQTDYRTHSLASDYLGEPAVQEYLNRRLKERRSQKHVDQQFVINKLLEIVSTDYVDSIQYLTKEQLDKIPPNVRLLVQSIEVEKNRTEFTNADGQERITENKKYKVSFMSKDRAIEMLGKHTGSFMKDNVQGTFDMNKMTFTDAMKAISEIPDDDK